jgi:hypothetical protein
LERAYFRTLWPYLPPELQDKDVDLDRSALIAMLRGDQPQTLLAVSLDRETERACALPRVIPTDDPSSFGPATAASRRIGLFVEPLRDSGRLALALKDYPRIRVAADSHEGGLNARVAGGGSSVGAT